LTQGQSQLSLKRLLFGKKDPKLGGYKGGFPINRKEFGEKGV